MYIKIIQRSRNSKAECGRKESRPADTIRWATIERRSTEPTDDEGDCGAGYIYTRGEKKSGPTTLW